MPVTTIVQTIQLADGMTEDRDADHPTVTRWAAASTRRVAAVELSDGKRFSAVVQAEPRRERHRVQDERLRIGSDPKKIHDTASAAAARRDSPF
jgi:hypothetical protein